MSTANGHSPTLPELQEQISLMHARRELRALQMADRVGAQIQESLYHGYTTQQWGELVDPMDAFRDADLRVTPLGTASRQDRQDGYNRPFVWAEFDLDVIRGQARWIATRNLLGVGAVNRIADYTTRTGFTYEARPGKRFRTDAVARELASQVEEVIEEFQSFNLIERNNERYTWANRERETVTKSVTDGDCLIRTFDQGPTDDGLTLVRFIEPEQLRQPLGSPSNYSFGILTDPDDIERALEYAVSYGNPDDWEPVPAEQVVHLKLNVPSVVKRGLSDFYPGAELFDDTRKMLRNMVVTGGVQSAIAWIEQFDQATAAALQTHIQSVRDQNRPDFTRPFTGRNINYQKLEPGSIPKVGAGRTYIPQPTAVNATSHTTTLQAGMRMLAQRWGMPEYMTGDASNANYSSTLVAGSPFVVATECAQALCYGPFFVRVMWAGPIRNAAKYGRFRVNGRRYTYEEISRLVDIIAIPPQVAIANLAQESQVDQADMQAGVMSKQTRRARRGLDNSTERHNIQEEPLKDQGQQPGPGPAGGPPQPGTPRPPGMEDIFAGLGEAIESRLQPLRELLEEVIVGKDKLGRKYCTQDGKRVDCPDEGDKPATQKPKGVLGKLLATAQVSQEAVSRVVRKLKLGAMRDRDPKTRKKLKAVARAIGWVESKVMIGFHKGKEMAAEMALERGASPEVAERTGKIIGVVDQALAWTTTFPVVSAVTGNPGVAKVASFLPIASLAYLGYSTARNPAATLRAAKKVFAGKKGTKDVHESVAPEASGALMDGLQSAGDQADWYSALVSAALEQSNYDLAGAVESANEALTEHPAPDREDQNGDRVWLSSLLTGPVRESVEWDEDSHPRASDGKFGSGGTSSSDTRSETEIEKTREPSSPADGPASSDWRDVVARRQADIDARRESFDSRWKQWQELGTFGVLRDEDLDTRRAAIRETAMVEHGKDQDARDTLVSETDDVSVDYGNAFVESGTDLIGRIKALGASDQDSGKLQTLLDRGEQRVRAASLKATGAVEKLMAADAKLHESRATLEEIEQAEPDEPEPEFDGEGPLDDLFLEMAPEGTDLDDLENHLYIEDGNPFAEGDPRREIYQKVSMEAMARIGQDNKRHDKWEKDYEKWERKKEKAEAALEGLEEKTNDLAVKVDESLDRMDEVFDEEADRFNTAFDSVVTRLGDALSDEEVEINDDEELLDQDRADYEEEEAAAFEVDDEGDEPDEEDD